MHILPHSQREEEESTHYQKQEQPQDGVLITGLQTQPLTPTWTTTSTHTVQRAINVSFHIQYIIMLQQKFTLILQIISANVQVAMSQ